MSSIPASPGGGPGSTGSPETPILKRRRVAKACQSCRTMKAKCDGQHPVCNRCKGYGHSCTWSEDKRLRSQSIDNNQSNSPVGLNLKELRPSSCSSEKVMLFRQVIQSYDELMKSLRPNLNESSRAAVDLVLSSIRHQLPEEEVAGLLTPDSNRATAAVPESFIRHEPDARDSNRQRYLGEASDLHFLYTVKRVLRSENELSENIGDNDMQGYDQEELHRGNYKGRGIPMDVPTREVADSYVDIYFFTIHIAYPFICKPSFMIQYETFWKGGFKVGTDSSWLSLLYTIFAIGAYYTSFPRSKDTKLQKHLRYFEQALVLAGPIMTDCTLRNVQMLLAQCFFLLATGHTDRCWTTLGLAIRAGQSIGLHVEDSLKRSVTSLSLVENETMRRTWYSMYVLDRLLALQLGRPVAIHEEDYCVNLPSKALDVNGEEPQNSLGVVDPSSVDYFHSVIKFSRILSQVISDLYMPSQLKIHPDRMLLSTTSLDVRLCEWKLNLPRHLRFDLGHTFEKSVVFRRQRNMLAIKFHHLRALIHRPYLCLAWLQRENGPLMALMEREHDRVDYLGNTCVLEAQQTAHLLHNVTDERSLVYDFPWWQMISCLLCASSILLVARACIEPDKVITELQSQALDEDAETCLKVFDALSANSSAARRARDMMKGLKETRISLPSGNVRSISDPVAANKAATSLSNGLYFPSTKGAGVDQSTISLMGHLDGNINHTLDESLHWGMRSDLFSWQPWPGELSDVMTWSAQFIDPANTLQSHVAPLPSTELDQ